MKNAKEIWAITEDTLKAEMERRKDKAKIMLEKSIAPQIETAAREGDFSIDFHVDASVDIDVIINTLKELEYDVTRKGRVLRIWWFGKK